MFRRRTMRDQFRIEGEASRLLGGPCEDNQIWASAVAYTTVAVMMASAPSGFDFDALDPVDTADREMIFTLYRSLREAEDRFLSARQARRTD